MAKELTFTEKMGYKSPFGEESLFNDKKQTERSKKLSISYRSTKYDKGNYTITVNITSENLNSKNLIVTVVEKEIMFDEHIASYTIQAKNASFDYQIKISKAQLQRLSKTPLEGDFEIVIKVYADGLEAQTKEIKLQNKTEETSNKSEQKNSSESTKSNEPNLKTEYDKTGKLISFEVYGNKYDAISIADFYELSFTYQAEKIAGKEIGNPISVMLDKKKITKKDLHPEIGSYLVQKDGIIYVANIKPNTLYDLTGCDPQYAKGNLKAEEVTKGYIHTHPASKETVLQLDYSSGQIGGGTLHGGMPSPDDFKYLRSVGRKLEIDVIVDSDNILIYNTEFFQSIKRVK